MSTPLQGDDKYIRTYAKDLALAQGAPPPASIVQDGGTVTDDTEAKRQEVLERLKARGEGAAISRSQMMPGTVHTPVQAPAVKDVADTKPPPPPVKQESWKPGELPTYAPQTPIPNVAPTESPTSVEAVIKKPEPALTPASLQPKAERPLAPPVPPPAPHLEAPPVPTYREPIPSSVELPTLAPPVAAPPPPSTLPSAPVVRADESSGLHTYSSDFSGRIDSKGASTFSVLAAQADAGAPATSSVSSGGGARKSFVYIAMGFFLIACAGGISYGAYRFVTSRGAVPLQQTASSLIFADERVEVTGEGALLQQSLLSAMEAALPQGGVRVFFLTVASSTPLGETRQEVPGGVLVGSLQLNAPSILIRNIGENSAVGVVAAGAEQRLFLILDVLSYERTFAGMLAWEPTILSNLSAFYPEYPAPPPPAPTIATTTRVVKGKTVISTTTIEAPAIPYSPPQFIDEIAANHNVRALKDGYGNTLLLYGYKDKETLIIARNEAAFARIIERLTATKTQ